MSQHQLAKRLRTRQEWISRYESGQRRLDIIQVWRVCRGIGVEPADFMRQLNDELLAAESGKVEPGQSG